MTFKKWMMTSLSAVLLFGLGWQFSTVVAADETAEASVEAVVTGQSDNASNELPSPAPGTSSDFDSTGYGADMPYTVYEAEKGQLANGANEQFSFDTESTAVEASYQKYVELPNQGASVSIQAEKPANAINIRYTIPDETSGQLGLVVNGNNVANIDLSSKSAWQYLDGDVEMDSPTPNSRARFRFDETRLLLDATQINAGDTVSLVKNWDDNTPYGIDLIELEQVSGPIAMDDNAISITSKGAYANDGIDDSQALIDAINEAKATGKNVYIPAGRFDLSRKIPVDASNIKISGAGMWYTHLHFTSDQIGGGGFEFNHNDNGIEMSDLYMDSNLTSRYREAAQYKAIAGTLGSNSYIHDIWEQHFEVGMWIGDYDTTGNMKYTDGLVVKNARIRNNLADGINFAQGTRNSTVTNSSIRGNGDDGLASWSSIATGTNASIAENNKFLHNTIELNWRAAGVGIFGGRGHEVAYNLIKDNFAGAGIRLSTVFAGHNFDLNDSGITIHHNYLLNDGTTRDLYNQKRGAIDLETSQGRVQNVSITNNRILNSFTHALNATYGANDNGFKHITFLNNIINGTGQGQESAAIRINSFLADIEEIGNLFVRLLGNKLETA